LALVAPVVFTVQAAKPIVWIYTDMSDKTIPGKNSEHTVNDPDDISAMAGYLLMCNEFDTRGIVVASTHRSEHKTSGDQALWASNYFGPAYRDAAVNLNKAIGGYPGDVSFMQSCIKESGERFSPNKDYSDLAKYPTVQALFNLARQETNQVNVLCWGSLTEPAILVRHCIEAEHGDVLQNMRFIAHWTDSSLHQGSPEHPENVANCREDAAACAYMKRYALSRDITYYECGAIGQHGIVSGSPKGAEYFDQFKVSPLGKIFAEGKFVHNSVDHSDAATYWTLLGTWGVSLKDIAPNGTNSPKIEGANEEKFQVNAKRIHDELLRRARAAVEVTE